MISVISGVISQKLRELLETERVKEIAWAVATNSPRKETFQCAIVQ